eukprot:TRINITY_DN21475_c0_g1_i1.p1 TRINITY_DN21475_c0_g1~~TRINITY_DN21475_c0_g1_i1.p1  ORF type:complete len:576 (+),score=185.51 TRINITY_DN21475_c0_g1_i1:78-1730(+)
MVPLPRNPAEARWLKAKGTEPLQYTAQEWAARLLGEEHSRALAWMGGVKSNCIEIAEGLEQVKRDKPLDRVVTCFSEVKLAYALQAGGAVFDAIDCDGNGVLSRQEIIGYLDATPELRERLEHMSEQRAKRDWALLFAMLDADGSGLVSREEFVDFWTASGAGDERTAHRLFEAADTDRSGELSNHELRTQLAAHPELQAKLSDGRSKQLENDWQKFFTQLDEATEESGISRDLFATLWADSGLGAAPDGLGIASQLTAQAQSESEGMEVPGLRMAKRKSAADREAAAPQLAPPRQTQQLGSAARLRHARRSFTVPGLSAEMVEADADINSPLLPVAHPVSILGSFGSPQRRPCSPVGSSASPLRSKTFTGEPESPLRVVQAPPRRFSLVQIPDHEGLRPDLADAVQRLPPLRGPYLRRRRPATAGPPAGSAALLAHQRAAAADATPPCRDISSRITLIQSIGTVAWRDVLAEQEAEQAVRAHNDTSYRKMLGDLVLFQERQAEAISGHYQRVAAAAVAKRWCGPRSGGVQAIARAWRGKPAAAPCPPPA